MFAHITNPQNLADRIKAFVSEAKVPKWSKNVATNAIQDFETLPWIPMLFEEAVKIEAPRFTISLDSVSYDGSEGEALEALDALMRRYRSLVLPQRELTAEQAAEHLHIGIDQFKTYAYRQKKIVGRLVGKTTLFSERELNRFDLERRKRPRKEDKSEDDSEE